MLFGTRVGAQIKTALDGSIVEHFNGPSLPATFFAFGGGVATYDESTGDLFVDRTGFDEHALTYVELADALLRDVSIRLQARLLRSDFTSPL